MKSRSASDTDLTTRLYRQGGANGPAGQPRLVSNTNGRQPLIPRPSGAPAPSSSSAATLRATQRQAGSQVLVPHTNYKPITLPALDRTSQPIAQGSRGGLGSGLLNTKGSNPLIGTRNATVSASLVGPQNIPGTKVRISDDGEQTEEHQQLEAVQLTDGDGLVDPADPSWISPADFVEFILNHESLTEEFCYMNRSGPYEFEIVPFSKINPNDYMTISIRGVTHYANGELDYQDLSEWQRDQEMYRKIIQISFFEKYQRWKLFSVWKSAMRNQRVQKCSKTLNAHLFALDGTLRDSLLKCRQYCVKIASTNLLEVNQMMTYPLEEFEEAQRHRRTAVLKELEGVWLQIKTELLNSSRVSLQKFLKANGFGEEAEEKAGVDNSGGLLLPVPAQDKNATQKDAADEGSGAGPVQQSYTERATTRTQCRKLTKFIRVVQYIFNDGIAQMVLYTTQRLLDIFDGFEEDFNEEPKDETAAPPPPGQEKKARKPNFQIQCLLEEKGLRFNPAGSLIHEAIETCLREAMKATSSMHTFLQCDDFNDFTGPLAELGDVVQVEESGNDLYNIISQDPKFKELMYKIGLRYTGLFDRVVNHCSSYEKFVHIFQENAALTDPSVTFAEASLDDLREELQKYRTQLEDINKMGRSNDIGLFRLDSKQMQEILIPSPQRCFKLLAEYIPAVALEKQSALMSEVKVNNAKLEAAPENVDDFVEYNVNLAKVDKALPKLTERMEEITEMLKIISDFSIRIDQDSRKAFGDLQGAWKTMQTAVNSGKDRIESDSAQFIRSLEADIPELNTRVQEQTAQLQNPDLSDVSKMGKEERVAVLEMIDKFDADVSKSVGDAARFNRYQDVLKVEQTPFEEVDELKTGFAVRAKLWRGIDSWEDLTSSWNSASFNQVDVEVMTKKVMEYNKIAVQSGKAMPDNEVPQVWGAAVAQFKNTLPVVVALRNKALKPRHWEGITALIGEELNLEDEEFTLGTLLNMGVDQHMEAIQEISGKATAELALEEMLAKVRKTWDDQELNINNYKDSKELFVLGSIEDITVALEDSLVTISTIAGSRYVGPIREEVEEWQKNLLLFQETLDEWLNVQRNWMYLESIFGAGDIKKQLPTESAKFAEVDTTWRAIMKETHEYAVALKAATKPGRLETFKTANDTLDQIQKSLEDYLLSKCVAFPRFFFLSNDELLEILSQARNPRAVQPHLNKCFDNLVKLRFGEGSNDIFAMISAENEEIPFYKPLKARGNVEKWLSNDGGVEEFMVKTLRACARKGYDDYREAAVRKEWVRVQYVQVMITVGSIYWTDEAEVCLKSSGNRVLAMGKFFEKNKTQLAGLTELIRDQLTKNQRKGVVALVTQDVHNRDIIEDLVTAKVTNIMNFKWQQQLRYYWDHEIDDCVIRQVDARILYGHEYMGALSRLVITPLTDRCWMTITGALHIKLGAAPAGPAGTGKTESTKDLAKGLARQCVVFNCSDQIDYKMMGKLYSGVVSAGSWTCLDEFNRISIEVLSVIAQQVLEIRQALLQGLKDFVFEGRHLKVVNTCGIFITMNPGYAGRTELPDNLKVLFRPVAMMVPNYTLIAEIMLYAEGYGAAKILSGKFTKLYQLSSEQLSKQDHYDFGMRAVKSVLVMAGSLKRAEPEEDENILLIRAMRDSNVPKFLSHDLPLFFAITNDLFPGIVTPYMDYGSLQVEIENALEKQSLQVHDKLVMKTIQLFETFNVRFGVMLVGPTLGGKTTDYRTLALAMTQLRDNEEPDERYQRTRYTVFNPKSITMGELYGEFNELTLEWTDGLGSKIMRGFCSEDSPDYKWTVFDGPVDAIWIESMNTVLDDNMTLCLANGERIKLNWTMRMLFEVQDLAVASPATVSRCGMVYLTDTDLGWVPFTRTWCASLPEVPFTEECKDLILSYLDTYIPKGLELLRKGGVEPVQTMDTQLVISCCRLFQAILNDACATANGASSKDNAEALTDESVEVVKPANLKEMDPAEFKKFLMPSFCFAFAWTLGGTGDVRTRKSFERAIEEWFSTVTPPRNGGPFDGWINYSDSVKMKNWTELVPPFKFQEGVSYFQLMVQSADTIRFSYIIDKMMSSQFSVFLTGVSGVGKSVIISSLLENMKTLSSVVPVYMTFSAQTKAYATQITIEGKLEKKKKTLLGAPVNKTVVILVDDINMPLVEEYGAQPPVELLRQFQDDRKFFDRKKHDEKYIENVTLLLCAAPPGGGRNKLTMRFSRHSHVICMPPTSEEAMATIFGSILSGFLGKFKGEIQALSNAAVAGTIELYNKCGDELLPTPTRPHYTFNLRDVSKVFQGLLMVNPKFVPNADSFTRLWYHEISRVFVDRLICHEDKEWFNKAAAELLKSRFRVGDTDPEIWNKVFWCEFLRPIDSRVYEEAKDPVKVIKALEDACDDYNLTHTATMELVFFSDCVSHVSRASRVFRQPRGNLMQVGVGGSGRSSCARLCACMCEANEFDIALTKGYGLDAFREDEKKFLMAAGSGMNAKSTMFLMSDTQIINETFLEDLNNILNAGEVPNLFPSDEMERVIGDTRPRAKELGRSEARDAVWMFFIETVRDNLHIVLTMSPVGSALRVRMRMFPALVNCCTIDWFLPWPDEALLGVAKMKLQDMQGLTDDMKLSIGAACCDIHQIVLKIADKFEERLRRKVYCTPKSYLDLIALYMEMIIEKRDEKNVALKRLQTGVTKIDEANAGVNDLQEELTKMAPFIAVKIKEADELVPVVKVEQGKAEEVKTKVQAEEAVVREQADKVREVQEDAQKDLDVAMPALEAALKSLDALDKKDIQEIKSFAKPPTLVMMTMEAVNILLSEKEDWDTAKKVLTDTNFMTRLKTYDKDNIPPKILKKLEKYVNKPEYTAEAVGNQSKAAKSLCMWTFAMDTYSKVAKEVEPKKAKVAELTKQLNAANAALKEKQDALQAILDQVASLEKRLNDTISEKDRLEAEQALTKARLGRADILTVGLADEGVRWRATVDVIKQDIIDLTGDVFLSAAAISYYGPFTGVYRAEIVDAWLASCKEKNIPCADIFNLSTIMGNPVEIRDWNLQGLPTDSVSINNGVMTVRGKRWPLMIDPQSQGNKWIKKKEAQNLKMVKITNPKMLLILEGCIRTGTTLLMEDIGESLDPALEPVLLKATYENNGRIQIKLGDQEVDYDKNFSFVLTTKMPNPHYFPEVCIKVTIINFTVTFEGLEEQLLNEVVEKEIPEVLARRVELMLQLADDKKTLKQLEDKILKLLSEATGNILDNEVLINTLAESKVTSTDVNARVAEAETASIEIDKACKEYTQVATAGSVLYFVIAELANINPMYQFSLSYFIRLFKVCIDKTPKSPILDVRMQYLIDNIANLIFIDICRGLFEDAKLTTAFIIATSFQRYTEEINSQEWSLLLRGITIMDFSERPPNPHTEFFTDKMWDFVYAIQVQSPEHCGDLCQHITDNVEEWEKWTTLDDPHKQPLPLNYDETNDLHYVQVLLLLKGLCAEKLVNGIQEHVFRSLGRGFIIYPSTTMEELYVGTSKSTPCIFILSTGADPTSMLLRFAQSLGTADTMGIISLGQGQDVKANKMVTEGSKKGTWVLLQNCHLYKTFMPSLEKMCETLEESHTVHKDFRLFLTSMPAAYFPVPVLQNGVKLTVEPPKGLRANVMRSFLPMTEEELNDSAKPAEWRRIQFGLKFFHACIQERRKFGPLGWNIRYEFNDSDLETSTVITHNMLELEGEIPWDTLLFVIGHINYGGRVTDDLDRRCLLTTLEKFVTPDILNPEYQFSASGTYKCPPNSETATLDDFRKWTDAFPLSEMPEVFGMHDNANISYLQQQSELILSVVLSIQPREAGGSGGGKGPEEIVTDLCIDQEQRLPLILTEENAHSTTFALIEDTGLMRSLGTCLGQEYSRFNLLLQRLAKTLKELQKAIKGTIVMTGELDSMFQAELNNQVPTIWTDKVGYPSLKPLSSWYEDMILRVEFFRDWIEHGDPISYWISSFYFPQGFLTSVLQGYSRANQIPVDVLAFENEVIDEAEPTELDEPPPEGIYIHGIFMDGAGWDYEEMRLSPQEFGVMFIRAPVINMQPCKDKVPNKEKFAMPLYKTSVRAGTLSTTGHSTNFVMTVEVECAANEPPSFWILKGAAFLTMLND